MRRGRLARVQRAALPSGIGWLIWGLEDTRVRAQGAGRRAVARERDGAMHSGLGGGGSTSGEEADGWSASKL